MVSMGLYLAVAALALFLAGFAVGLTVMDWKTPASACTALPGHSSGMSQPKGGWL